MNASLSIHLMINLKSSFLSKAKFTQVFSYSFFINITMAANAAANTAQRMMGEKPVEVTNEDRQQTSDTTMLACVWVGKDNLEMRTVPKPEITDDEDVILKITGSTGNKE